MKLDKKLGKLKMPPKRKTMDMSDLLGDADPEKADAAGSSDGSDYPDDESQESPDEEAAEGPNDDESKGHDAQALEHASDDELMAEVKKRGLMKQLEQHGDSGSDQSDDGSDQSMYK